MWCELQSTLPVSDRDGLPIVVQARNLLCAAGVLRSRDGKTQAAPPHLNELTEHVDWFRLQEQARHPMDWRGPRRPDAQS
ncbi:MAG TPA: hypothetical protein VM532_07600 [Burkholderiales bacterium]|nr:hypothetical protein [Burkholderiales bacterium]